MNMNDFQMSNCDECRNVVRVFEVPGRPFSTGKENHHKIFLADILETYYSRSSKTSLVEIFIISFDHSVNLFSCLTFRANACGWHAELEHGCRI